MSQAAGTFPQVTLERRRSHSTGYLLELFRSKGSQGKAERIITKAVSGAFPVPLFQQVVLDKVH